MLRLTMIKHLFNEYFHSVFVRSSYVLPSTSVLKQPSLALGEINFSELDVFHTLQSLDTSKASGGDGISPKLLKLSALALYQPLYYLFSITLLQNYLPSDWRIHVIKPILKSGDRSSVKNYRPISLLPVVSKVLERLVYNCMLEFVTNSISPYQFGFLRGRSTLQQLLIFFDTILNSGPQTDVLYLDFKKAFDSVSHNELLHKLWNFGITDNLWLWIKAYLTNRLQCVSIGNSISTTLPVISGVPQGSILGPLLFIIFINDLPAVLSSAIIFLYADDTKCLMPISTMCDCKLLQDDLTRLSKWCSHWNLSLNELKCSAISFTTKAPSNNSPILFKYEANGKQISSKYNQKDLGITVSADLSWRPHYQLIISKAYKMLGLLRRVFSKSVSISAKRSLHVSLVRPHLLYCSPIWHPYLLTDIRTLELVQRRATKFIIDDTSVDYKSRLIQLELLPLMMELEIADIIFLIKSLRSPSPHFNVYNFVEFSSYSTRSFSNLKLRHSISKTNLEASFYFYRIPRLWNSLPTIDINLSLYTIKHKLRQYFWDHFISYFDPNDVCSFHYLCLCHRCSSFSVKTHLAKPFSTN